MSYVVKSVKYLSYMNSTLIINNCKESHKYALLYCGEHVQCKQTKSINDMHTHDSSDL